MSGRADARSLAGARMAQLLSGSWREPARRWNGDEGDLVALAPLLLRNGTAGLAWRRLRSASTAPSAAATGLREAYRSYVLRSALDEEQIASAVRFLRAAGFEPVLGKGWAAARSYRDPGARPHGDIDLYVEPEVYAAVRARLADPRSPARSIDLHRGFAQLDDRSAEDIRERSVTATVAGVSVRTFGPEDHLRLLCLHALKHGVLRPLWLCDIAAAIESRASGFDWDRFLLGDPCRARWAVTALALAHAVLGADVGEAPQAQPLPAWVVPSLLREWGEARAPQGAREPISGSIFRPLQLLRALRVRWPNAIEATVGVRGSFSGWPRLPYQIAECLRRGAAFARAAASLPDKGIGA